jgi:hypothetical protein
MVTPDRIRLIGLLKENPAFAGFSHFTVEPACITRASRDSGLSGAERPIRKVAVRKSAWLSETSALTSGVVASSERRLLTFSCGMAFDSSVRHPAALESGLVRL